MEDIIIIAVLVAILGGAAWYIYKAKKSGKKCIGCPDGASCSCGCGGADKAEGGCSGGCGCGCSGENE